MTNTISRYDLENALADNGIMWEEEDGFRDDYSGRGMSGRTCIGVVVGRYTADNVKAALLKAAEVLRDDIESDEDGLEWDAEEELAENLVQLAEATCVDNMGLDMIVYWPGWEFSD